MNFILDLLSFVQTLRVSLLLPSVHESESDPHSITSYNQLEKVRPGVQLAESAFATLLPGWKLEVSVGDTKCSSTYGPLAAIELRCNTGPVKKAIERDCYLRIGVNL